MVVYIIAWRGLAALLILDEGQCEGLNAGMGEKLESPMPFLFPYTLSLYRLRLGERVGRKGEQNKKLYETTARNFPIDRAHEHDGYRGYRTQHCGSEQ